MGAFRKMLDKFAEYSPEIKVPLRKIPLQEKIANTILALLFFMILSEIPLPSVDPSKLAQVQMLEYVLGVSRGTLFSEGIYPIIMGSFIVQLLVIFRVIKVKPGDMSEYDKLEKFKHFLTVLFVVFLGLGMALKYSYPTPKAIITSFILFTLGGLLLMLLVDYIDKYGFYSGISMIILLRASKAFFMYLFNPINNPRYGLVTQLILALKGVEPYKDILLNPSYVVIPIIGTFGLIFLLVYLQTAKVVIAKETISYKYQRVLPKKEYPLLFLSVVPLIFGTILMQAIREFIVGLGNIITPLSSHIGNAIVNFANYWFLPPYGWYNFNMEPLRGLFYYGVLLVVTYFITYVYLFFSNMTPSRIHIQLEPYIGSRRLSRNSILVKRARRIMRVLIPISVVSIIAIAFIGNYLMVAGGGTGLVLSVSIAISLYKMFKAELKKLKVSQSALEFIISTIKLIPKTT